MNPIDCPRFQTCSAPVCPLDPVPTAYLPGEAVCHYLRSSGKIGAAEHFRDDPVYHECLLHLETLRIRHPPMGRQIDAAAKTPIKRVNW